MTDGERTSGGGTTGRARAGLLLVVGALAVLLMLGFLLWKSGETGEDATSIARGARSVDERTREEPAMLAGGGEGEVVRYAFTIAPPDEDVAWSLEAQAASGWSAERDGVGTTEVELDAAPREGFWLHVVPDRSDLLDRQMVILPAEPLPQGLVLAFARAARLVGKARHEGNGVPGVGIEVARLDPPGVPPWAKPRLPLSRATLEASTDADGHYAVEGLASGTHAFQARHPGYVGPLRRTLEVREPGHTYEIDLDLETGIRITGRVFEASGDPFAGARLHVLREESPGTFDEDCWVEADDEGVFLTPTLAHARSFRLQVVTGEVGRVLLLDRPVPGPHEALVDVGVLQPIPTVTRFVLPADRPDDTYSLVASVVGTWDDEPAHVVVGSASFDADGTCEVTGFPFGRLSYSVLALQGGRNETEWVSGEVEIKERAPVILVAAPVPDPTVYGDTPRVEVRGVGGAGIDLMLLHENEVVFASTLPALGDDAALPRKLPEGAYVLLARQGDSMGRLAFEVPGSDAHRLDLAGRGTAYKDVWVEVYRDGRPLAGAIVAIRGFDVEEHGGRGRAFPSATDADGRALVRGIPASVRRVVFSVMDVAAGEGRSRNVSLPASGSVRLDL